MAADGAMQSASGSYRNLAALADGFDALTEGAFAVIGQSCRGSTADAFACMTLPTPQVTQHSSNDAKKALSAGGPLSFGDSRRKQSRNSIDSQDGRSGKSR